MSFYPAVFMHIIKRVQYPTAACTDYMGNCPAVDCINDPAGDGCLSLINHLRWPDGDYNNPTAFVMDREPDMLLFLKNNPF